MKKKKKTRELGVEQKKLKKIEEDLIYSHFDLL